MQLYKAKDMTTRQRNAYAESDDLPFLNIFYNNRLLFMYSVGPHNFSTSPHNFSIHTYHYIQYRNITQRVPELQTSGSQKTIEFLRTLNYIMYVRIYI